MIKEKCGCELSFVKIVECNGLKWFGIMDRINETDHLIKFTGRMFMSIVGKKYC